ALTVAPTWGLPLIFAFGTTNVAALTVAAGLTTVRVAYPAWEPVTATLTFLPFAEAGTFDVRDVALATALPSRRHWYRTVVGVGVHGDRFAVRVLPTCTVPESEACRSPTRSRRVTASGRAWFHPGASGKAR